MEERDSLDDGDDRCAKRFTTTERGAERKEKNAYIFLSDDGTTQAKGAIY
jgi:hypothetical protein